MKTLNFASLKESTSNFWHISKPYHALIFFIAGFLFDILTLEEVDDMLTLVSQVLYLLVAVGFFLINAEGKTRLRLKVSFNE